LVARSPSAKTAQTVQTISRKNPIVEMNSRKEPNCSGISQDSVHSLEGVSTHGVAVDGNGNVVNYAPEGSVINSGVIGKGEPSNPIYHLTRFSDLWLLTFLVIHCVQFGLLLDVGYKALPHGGFGTVLILAVAVVVLMLVARYLTKKSHLSELRNVALNDWKCSPSDEADNIPDSAVLCIATAAVLEGFTFAIFTSVSSGNYQYLSETGFYTKATILQVLRFASITLLALHRTIRPANRLDPMRTVLELEVISVCWDALDGSTLYQLLDGSTDLSNSTENAVRVLMAAWYFSVGIRIAMMFITNLAPNSKLQSMTMTMPFQLAPQPTVDRTLQGLRLRLMLSAEF
jgi:multisubunit Na+/H+ antiporter MnhB subunit